MTTNHTRRVNRCRHLRATARTPAAPMQMRRCIVVNLTPICPPSASGIDTTSIEIFGNPAIVAVDLAVRRPP